SDRSRASAMIAATTSASTGSWALGAGEYAALIAATAAPAAPAGNVLVAIDGILVLPRKALEGRRSGYRSQSHLLCSDPLGQGWPSAALRRREIMMRRRRRHLSCWYCLLEVST